MHIADGEQYFADIEHSNVVAKPSILPQAIEELSPRAKLEDHVDEGIVLEGGFEGIDEGVVELAEDALLKLYVLHLLQVDYVGLRDLLQGEHLLRWAQHELYSPEGPRSEGLRDLVFGDVCWVAILRACALGFGGVAIGFCPEGRTDFFPLSLLL